MIIQIIIFMASLFVLVASAEFFLGAAERVGVKLGFSPFIVGVLIVGIGTSLPELASSLVAVFSGALDMPVANAVGSNIANILLVVGVSALVAKKLEPTKSLINLDLPLLAYATTIFYMAVKDGQVTFGEAVVLLLSYGVYMAYTVLSKEDGEHDLDRKTRRQIRRMKLHPLDFVKLIGGLVGLVLSSKFLVSSVISLSEILNIATGIISVSAVAFGTSLPELVVAIKAARQGKSEIVLGNIFGSNIFNILVVVGVPGLFSTLTVDEKTVDVGLLMLIGATLLFIITGISKRVHFWDGAFYIILYVFFIGKLFNFI